MRAQVAFGGTPRLPIFNLLKQVNHSVGARSDNSTDA
jgi:hypothetical protein